MLTQQIVYKDDIPVNITICDIRDYPVHFHDDIELIFLLRGRIKLRNGYHRYTMREGDVYATNYREVHAYKGFEEPNICMIMNIDTAFFSRYYPEFNNAFFVTDPSSIESADSVALREILSRIVMEYVGGYDNREERIIEQCHSLLSLLLDNFQNFRLESGRFVNAEMSKRNKILAERMFRIQEYLYDNYNRKLTLQEIADHEHLSVYYLSHVIKEATGMSFKDFLCFVRTEESEKLLLSTDLSISAISDTIGFSAVRYYIKYFKQWYGMTPKEYRNSHGNWDSKKNEPDIKNCDVEDVCAAISSISNSVYRNYVIVRNVPTVNIEAELSLQKNSQVKDTALGEFFAEKTTEKKAASLLYELLINLKSKLASSGNNYIITASDDGETNAAILIYNLDAWKEGKSPSEYIFTLHGLTGNYLVRRIKYSEQNIKASEKIAKAKSQKKKSDIRDVVYNRIDSYPVVTESHMTAIGSLSFDIQMEEFCGMLILIDRK